jgi:acyl carrier protein phosphodiesterase
MVGGAGRWREAEPVNFLGHVAVAIGCGRDSDEELLGCVLPDLVGMAGLPVDKGRLAPLVLAGIECHHATDAAFHGHPVFVAGTATMRDRLAESRVSAGPRRAVGHVGWELLLDGEIGRSDRVTDAFEAALAAATRPSSGLDDTAGGRWASFGTRLRRSQVWHRYQDPSRLAATLDSILARRPRLALRPGEVDAVRDVLHRSQPEVTAVAAAVVADVTAAVRGARA